ncbi:UNKNOWN [Stylonychia lemnae]|uniref:Dynein light chain n=1 Tax=Stylonychia lemnae TaxID=5949 RepID=A0A078AHV8_STYLE|nr:UNKNOWN [Stylonychia lemnae]|eukprot:CDW81486.1 UNKNOWN [Stylonychia lemnae]
MEASDKKQFTSIKTQIEKIVDDKVDEIFKDYNYDGQNAQEKSNQVAEAIVKEAQQLASKNFKLQAIAMVLNKETSGFHLSASCYWDSTQDGNINKKFDKFETFYVIITLFGISRA